MMERERDYDVVVVGGGAGGMSAALEAKSNGASVLLVEAARELGGALALSGGTFMAAGTSVQRAAGHDDSADLLYDYYVTFSRWQIEPALVRLYCDNAAPTLEWLIEQGAQYPPENLYKQGLEPAPRSHRAVGEGRAVAEALARRCRASGVDIAVGTRIEGLIIERGIVRGVRARGEDMRAGSVVLTTGNFSHDPELLARYFPDAAAAGDRYWTPYPATCRGDGLRMALAAGASTSGQNHGNLLLSTALISEFEPFRPGWLVFVNDSGRRIVNESAPYNVVDGILKANGNATWVILDEDSRLHGPGLSDQRFGSGFWHGDTISQFVETGDVLREDSVAALAGRMGIAASALHRTIDRYNSDVAAGVDTQYLKPASDLRPVATPPFYAVRIHPCHMALTGFGVRIDERARVLDEENAPIQGLFAAGDMTGNVMGPQYVASGQSVGKAVIFGRIAGRCAAAHAEVPVESAVR